MPSEIQKLATMLKQTGMRSESCACGKCAACKKPEIEKTADALRRAVADGRVSAGPATVARLRTPGRWPLPDNMLQPSAVRTDQYSGLPRNVGLQNYRSQSAPDPAPAPNQYGAAQQAITHRGSAPAPNKGYLSPTEFKAQTLDDLTWARGGRPGVHPPRAHSGFAQSPMAKLSSMLRAPAMGVMPTTPAPGPAGPPGFDAVHAFRQGAQRLVQSGVNQAAAQAPAPLKPLLQSPYWDQFRGKVAAEERKKGMTPTRALGLAAAITGLGLALHDPIRHMSPTRPSHLLGALGLYGVSHAARALDNRHEKVAFLPALAAALPAIGSAVGGFAARTGLMAAGRAGLGMASRALANPVGNLIGQQALGMGAQKLMQPRQPNQPMPGQIGGV